MSRMPRKRRSCALIARGLLVGLQVLGLALGTAAAAHAGDALDEDLMYDIDDQHAAVKSALGSQNAARAAADARKLRALFAAVERHYASTGGKEDAVGFARKGQALSEQIATGAAANNWPQALTAYQALNDTCKGCHARYKP